MKKPAKIIDFAAKKHARAALKAFDQFGHEKARETTQKREEVERKARETN